jgi:hypothetical protein
MAEPMSEKERRALAEAHKDEIEVDSATPVSPKRLGQMISLRLDPDVAIALRDLAVRRGMSVSDLLREGAARVLASAEQAMQVTHFRVGVDIGSRAQTFESWVTPTGSEVLPGLSSFGSEQFSSAA